MEIRIYNSEDYRAIAKLYKNSETFGGQFDELRDAKVRLDELVAKKPEAILVAVENEIIVGTVTLFEDRRSAWLYRFAVLTEFEHEAVEKLGAKAKEILKKWGHSQMLVYAPAKDTHFEKRYKNIGFAKGNDFTAYWQNL